MMKRLAAGLTGLGMMALAQGACAEERAGPGVPVQVRFDRESGCWPANGWQDSDAVNFDFKVTKAGTFIFVQMMALPDANVDDGPMAGRDVTVSLMNKGRWVSNLDLDFYDRSQTSMIGKAMVKGSYEVGFGPTAYWGSRALVRICHSMENSFPAMPFKLPQSK